MDKLKKVVIFFGAIAILYFVSNFLIAVIINSTYKPMESIESDDSNLEIIQAESTLINGRIKGIVKNSEAEFLKLQLFSERDNNLGTRYIEIPESSDNNARPVEVYYKVRDSKKYKVELTNEKGPDEDLNISLLPKDVSFGEVFWGVALILCIIG